MYEKSLDEMIGTIGLSEVIGKLGDCAIRKIHSLNSSIIERSLREYGKLFREEGDRLIREAHKMNETQQEVKLRKHLDNFFKSAGYLWVDYHYNGEKVPSSFQGGK